MVPEKYYFDNTDEDPVQLKYMKKGAKVDAKRERKEAAKKRKREKLDPDKAKTALDIQLDQAKKKQRLAEKQGASSTKEEDAEQGDRPGPSALRFDVPTGAEPPADELRQRLHQRIEEMRAQRKADEERKARAKAAKEWKQQATSRAKQAHSQREQKRTAHSEDELPEQRAAKKARPAPADEEGALVESAKLSFGRVELGTDGPRRGPQKKHKPTKAELLEAAKAKLETVKVLEGTKEGRVAVEQEAWKAAMARARGERVLDDPKLLSRSLKKEQKLKKKKADAWKERKDQQRQNAKIKQKKRTENLKSRADTKIQNRKDKREKKLMRAGFEGRRDSFIGSEK
ncbi:g3803 [Coccomyxa elongata]